MKGCRRRKSSLCLWKVGIGGLCADNVDIGLIHYPRNRCIMRIYCPYSTRTMKPSAVDKKRWRTRTSNS